MILVRLIAVLRFATGTEVLTPVLVPANWNGHALGWRVKPDACIYPLSLFGG